MEFNESQIKCVVTRDHAWIFRDGFENRMVSGEVIVVLKMWRILKLIQLRIMFPKLTCTCYFDDGLWIETEGGLSDFRFKPDLVEVDEFRQSLLNSDFYVQRHGCIRPL
uniref:Uncharacterized protein n=1 Tax=Brassica oleracea var. oleracea TaxID=109376 RepID=A0A0D3CYQ7_BRAOL